MAGLMGNPIGTMGQDLGDNIDLNTIVNSGLYSTLSSQNQPDGYEEWYGLLAVSKFRTGEVIQTWTPNGTSSNGLLERKKNYNSNTWSLWQRIDNFGYNSLAELAGGVASEISPLTYLGYFNNETPYDSILKSGYGFSTPDDGSGILGHFIIMVYASSKAVIKIGIGGNCKIRASDLNGEWSEWKLL